VLEYITGGVTHLTLIVDNFEQDAKAELPIIVTEDGMLNKVRLLQL
jgi:hypothetical protein